MSKINHEHVVEERRWIISILKLPSDDQSHRCLFCIEGIVDNKNFLHAYVISHTFSKDFGNFAHLLIERRDEGNDPILQLVPSLSYYADAELIKSKLYSSIAIDSSNFNDKVNATCEFALSSGEYLEHIENTLKDRFLARWCEEKVVLVEGKLITKQPITPTNSQQSVSFKLTPASSNQKKTPEEPEVKKSGCCNVM